MSLTNKNKGLYKYLITSIKQKRVFDKKQNRLVNDIFAKLRRVSSRYINQKRILTKQNQEINTINK